MTGAELHCLRHVQRSTLGKCVKEPWLAQDALQSLKRCGERGRIHAHDGGSGRTEDRRDQSDLPKDVAYGFGPADQHRYLIVCSAAPAAA